MKTKYIIAALRNASTPAARLARWQSPTYGTRSPLSRNLAALRDYLANTYHSGETLASARRALIASKGPGLSSPCAESPLLWTNEQGPEILETYTGRDCGLDHRGWYSDDFQEENLETCAVRLARFPHLLFYAVKDSCNDDLRIHLDEWEEIDFSDVASDYQAEDAVKDSARALIRSNDSTTQREAEESQEFYRKDRAEQDIAENKETLAGLRQEIRALAHELKTLCQSSASDLYPVAARAVRRSLQTLLAERRELMAENEKLAASL